MLLKTLIMKTIIRDNTNTVIVITELEGVTHIETI